MKDPLQTYLHDHLAGATFAIEMLEALRDLHPAEPVGELAADILVEVEEDRTILQALATHVGDSGSVVKEVASWIAEKASRLKLRRQAEGALGTFETVEALALGIRGKESLWTALAVVAPDNPRLQGYDFAALAARAREQFDRVERQRLSIATSLFKPLVS